MSKALVKPVALIAGAMVGSFILGLMLPTTLSLLLGGVASLLAVAMVARLSGNQPVGFSLTLITLAVTALAVGAMVAGVSVSAVAKAVIVGAFLGAVVLKLLAGLGTWPRL